MQSFSSPEFTPKEMTISTATGQKYHYQFKKEVPFWTIPTKVVRTIRWVERNYHGIRYGPLGLNFTSKIFDKFQNATVYVKGAEKQKFLQKYFSTVINLEYQAECPKFVKTQAYCPHHEENGEETTWICSYINCKLLFNYVLYLYS